MNSETARESYLTKFKRENKPDEVFESTQVEITARKIVELLKNEDLTHEQAYASLQYAYNQIKYESNFLKLN